MTKQEIALQIFLKRMPHEPLRDDTRRGYISVAGQAAEIADVFLSEMQRQGDAEAERVADVILSVANKEEQTE